MRHSFDRNLRNAQQLLALVSLPTRNSETPRNPWPPEHRNQQDALLNTDPTGFSGTPGICWMLATEPTGTSETPRSTWPPEHRN